MTNNANSTPLSTKPQVGEGMTKMFPQDRYPYVITRVSDSGKTVWVKPLKTVSLLTGHKPSHYNGPFPVWSHDYTANELQTMIETDAPEIMVRQSKHGYWASHGITYARGGARFTRDYSL